MRLRIAIGVLGLSLVTVASAQGQAGGSGGGAAAARSSNRINPMIAMAEQNLPILGIAHPSLGRGGGGGGGGRGGGGRRGGGGGGGGGTAGAGGAAAGTAGAATTAAPPTPPAPPPPPPNFDSLAKETISYSRADFMNTSGANAQFVSYIEALTKAGGTAKTHPFAAKIPNWKGEGIANAATALHRQLNAGHMGIQMQYVESAAEVRDVVKAVRFASAGGTRPDSGYEVAAAHWGLTKEQYKQKADVWPLNPNGEIAIAAIVETLAGIDNVREIAAEPSVAFVVVGYGSLGGVFQNDPAGRDVARDAATAKILAACKEFKKPCGFPTNNPDEMTRRYTEGFRWFVMQSRNEAGMGAVETARKLSGRN